MLSRGLTRRAKCTTIGMMQLRPCARRRGIRNAVLPHDGIVPEFLVAYSTYVCKNPDCVKSMILPPVYEQLFIMQQMFDLTIKVDISGLEGPFMKLFMMHDTHGVEVLANALLNYLKSKEVIESVVEYTKEIPGLVIDTVEM